MSVVTGHVCDIGEAAKAVIPFERVSITTYPNRCGIPNEMMEEDMAQRKRTALELAHPNAAGIDIGSASHFAVSYTHLRAHETVLDIVFRLLLEKKKQQHDHQNYCTISIYNVYIKHLHNSNINSKK